MITITIANVNPVDATCGRRAQAFKRLLDWAFDGTFERIFD